MIAKPTTKVAKPTLTKKPPVSAPMGSTSAPAPVIVQQQSSSWTSALWGLVAGYLLFGGDDDAKAQAPAEQAPTTDDTVEVKPVQ